MGSRRSGTASPPCGGAGVPENTNHFIYTTGSNPESMMSEAGIGCFSKGMESDDAHLEVTGMPKLPATLFASEATLVVVDQHVVVETVLPRERCVANQTYERFDT